jgi:Cys-rich protein (TIGR01571 family)
MEHQFSPVQFMPQYGHAGPPAIQAQPIPQREMNPYVHRRPGNSYQYDTVVIRDWSHGLLDCCSDCGTCCLATWCPCMVYQQVKRRLDYLQLNGRPDPQHGGGGCGADCCIFVCMDLCFCLGFVLQVIIDL